VSTNLPNYKIELEGRSNKPMIVIMQDPGCLQNDSIVTYIKKQGYSVLRITSTFEDPFEALNSDDLNTRVQRGVQLLNELNLKFKLHGIAATGIEVHTNIPWIVNSRLQMVQLYPYYPGTLKDYLVRCMSNGTQAFPFYQNPFPPEELFTALQEHPAPSGMVNHYSYRLLESIWEQNPKEFLSMIEMEVVIRPIY
jgi:hypothetical protein